jgi:hypothetical protein
MQVDASLCVLVQALRFHGLMVLLLEVTLHHFLSPREVSAKIPSFLSIDTCSLKRSTLFFYIPCNIL